MIFAVVMITHTTTTTHMLLNLLYLFIYSNNIKYHNNITTEATAVSKRD